MTTASISRLVLTALAFCTLFTRPLAAADDPAVQSLAMDNAAFAFDLYGQLKATDGNLFFSPYSISTCLAMTYAGARGDTARQIASTLHFNADPVALAAPFATLQRQLNSAAQSNGIELNLANGLWADAAHKFVPAFLETATKQYAAKLEQVDFLTHSETARTDINGWVSKQTKGKITDLFSVGTLDSHTRLVLVNAVYFKGQWTNPFKTNQTITAPFAVNAGQKVQCQLMHLEAMFNYAETTDLQLLELPYGQAQAAPSTARLTMVVLLPKDPAAFESLEVALNSAALTGWLATAHRQEVSVFLPRFKMAGQFSLGDTLSTMGMTDAFGPHANFSGLDGTLDLFISAVVHKAFVEVNEQGTEAAAATGVAITARAVVRRTETIFRADHPFIFLIRDADSGSILFLGRLNDPTR